MYKHEKHLVMAIYFNIFLTENNSLACISDDAYYVQVHSLLRILYFLEYNNWRVLSFTPFHDFYHTIFGFFASQLMVMAMMRTFISENNSMYWVAYYPIFGMVWCPKSSVFTCIWCAYHSFRVFNFMYHNIYTYNLYLSITLFPKKSLVVHKTECWEAAARDVASLCYSTQLWRLNTGAA